MLRLRRVLMTQREVLNKLARGDYQVIDPEDHIFFRDVCDHLVRLHDITEGLRDLVGGAFGCSCLGGLCAADLSV